MARLTGENVRTLRFCADEGILPVERGKNRYRCFPPDAERRVGAVRRFQRLGFSLGERD